MTRFLSLTGISFHLGGSLVTAAVLSIYPDAVATLGGFFPALVDFFLHDRGPMTAALVNGSVLFFSARTAGACVDGSRELIFIACYYVAAIKVRVCNSFPSLRDAFLDVKISLPAVFS